ncbi:MAG: alpha/beta hydrolase [Chloroflexi bacterium]|nr:alpha/beta hydrolase [Chloroflexota bacterium]
MSSAKINGIDLHYQCYGEGEAIVFAHGAGGNLLSWWQQIPFFSQRYQCITFDHRGFGHSLDVPEGPGAAKFVDDLRGLLDHLGVESAHLVAQSMGGRTMLGFAVKYPDRVKTLVMADTVGGMNVPEVVAEQRNWAATNTASGEIGFRAVSPLFVQRSPNLANLYLQISRTNPPRHTPPGGLPAGPGQEELAGMKIPTLFFVGEDDQISPPQVIAAGAKAIAGSKLLKVPEAGHSVYFEKPEIFNFEVLRFIEGAHARNAA